MHPLFFFLSEVPDPTLFFPFVAITTLVLFLLLLPFIKDLL